MKHYWETFKGSGFLQSYLAFILIIIGLFTISSSVEGTLVVLLIFIIGNMIFDYIQDKALFKIIEKQQEIIGVLAKENDLIGKEVSRLREMK